MQRQRLLRSIYSASFFFTLHYAFLLYIGSSYLSQFFDPSSASRAVSAIYVIASVLSVCSIARTPWLFKYFGLARTTYGLLWAAVIAAVALVFIQNAWFAIPIFILLSVLQITLRYTLDVYIEAFSTEEITGQLRGVFMTVINTAIALSPVAVGFLVARSGFSLVFAAAAVMILIAVFSTHKKLYAVPEGSYHPTRFFKTVRKIISRPNIYHAWMANFILELFYAWMVIYTPLYLVGELGFAWEQVGIIFSIMLIPFVIFELPAGYLADKRYGEKEILTLGFLIMGFSTIAVAYFKSRELLPWALLLFCTRIGASLVEIMVDTYFFKKVRPEDTDIIALFRSAKPLATLVAPVLAAIILGAGNYHTLFLVLGVVVLYGVRHSLAIEDTK